MGMLDTLDIGAELAILMLQYLLNCQCLRQLLDRSNIFACALHDPSVPLRFLCVRTHGSPFVGNTHGLRRPRKDFLGGSGSRTHDVPGVIHPGAGRVPLRVPV